MSGKRSRVGSSSNFIEKKLFNHKSLPANYEKEVPGASSYVRKPAKCLKPSLGEGNKEQSWKNTVLKSTAHESISGGLGSFLKNCYYCKKLIDQGKDVYMYRDLCAFCTEDCRSLQIELDEKSQMQSAKSGGVVQEQDLIVLDNGSFVVKH